MCLKRCAKLHLSNSNGAFRANLYTGFTTQTFIGMHGLGLTILHLKHLRRTGIHTFLIASTLVLINNNFPQGCFLQRYAKV